MTNAREKAEHWLGQAERYLKPGHQPDYARAAADIARGWADLAYLDLQEKLVAPVRVVYGKERDIPESQVPPFEPPYNPGNKLVQNMSFTDDDYLGSGH